MSLKLFIRRLVGDFPFLYMCVCVCVCAQNGSPQNGSFLVLGCLRFMLVLANAAVGGSTHVLCSPRLCRSEVGQCAVQEQLGGDQGALSVADRSQQRPLGSEGPWKGAPSSVFNHIATGCISRFPKFQVVAWSFVDAHFKGTTVKACQKTGRKAQAFEEPEFGESKSSLHFT